MKRFINFMIIVGLLVVLATSANATTMSLSGGATGTIPNGAINEFISVKNWFPSSAGGYYGSQVYLDVTSNIKIEFFGAEAGFHNVFNFDGEDFDHPGGTNIASDLSTPLDVISRSSVVGSVLLLFSFDVNIDENKKTLTNGQNVPNEGYSPNFFASFNPFTSTPGSGGTTGDVLYLFLDDGGAGNDDNHDDFLVRITATAVPEPATLLLLGFGLTGLAAIGRKPRG